MEYRRLGGSGLKVSAVGLGTNQFGGKVDAAGVLQILERALDLGINFIDTADIYARGRSEETLGEALRGRWDEVVLATKVGKPMGEGPNDRGASRYRILGGVEASLRRLGTDHIDLYQLHEWDPDTPVEETMRALEDLVRSGKVRYMGASNFVVWQLAQANALAEARGWTAFVSIQPEYHLLARGIEAELLPFARDQGVGVIPYFPLAGGLLTSKYRRGQPPPPGSRAETSRYVQQYLRDEVFDVLEALEAFARERERGLNELAIAWLLAQPAVATVIAGATRPEHVEANACAGDWRLTPEEEAEVRRIVEGAAREQPQPA